MRIDLEVLSSFDLIIATSIDLRQRENQRISMRIDLERGTRETRQVEVAERESAVDNGVVKSLGN